MPAPESDSSDLQAGATGGSEDFERWILPPLRNCSFLTGPTASGKTPLAIAVARRLDAEIISLDSMAIYRGMDIGTAKPTPAERAQVPHHQLDIVEPTDNYSVSNYVLDAHAAAADIHSRGRRVLVCGGTPLYLKGLLRGLFLGPPADWDFRASVEADVLRHGSEALRERLLQVDPLLAHKLHPNDHRRMIRALEVARITGQPLSHWQQQFDEPASPDDCAAAVLRLDRGWLHQRINDRVESMIARGLEAEVRGLLDKYSALGKTASQAVGYREMLERLRDPIPWPETIELIKAHTRQFARRQEIWFRGLPELQGVEVVPQAALEDLVDRIVEIFTRSPRTGIS